jgi:cation-transporting ATPase 13A1
MLSGESTPLLKESIELLEGNERLDLDAQHKGNVLFSGTKVLQASGGGGSTPDGGCLAIVLRTGFGTAQGQLVRTMIFSSERVSANNMESFLFIGFLLIFAVAASWYVWVNGEQLTIEMTAMHFHRMLTPCFPRAREGIEKREIAFGLHTHCYQCRSS